MLSRTLAIIGLLVLYAGTAQALPPLPSGASVALLRAPEVAKNPALEADLTAVGEELGYQVTSPDVAADSLRKRSEDHCPTSQECDLGAVREALDVDAVALFVLLKGGGIPQLLVRVARAGGEHEASHELVRGDRRQALERVLQHALGGREDVRLTTVLITSVPPRALVGVDRKPVQEAPARFVVLPGKHTIRGRLRGYAPVVEQVTIPAQDAPFDYQLTLPQRLLADEDLRLPTAGKADPAGPPRAVATRPSAWNYLLAGTLGAAAIGLGTYTFVLVRKDGTCAARAAESGTCYSEYDNGLSAIAAGVGAGASAVGALAFLIWTPITVSASPDTGRLSLHYRGSF